MSTETDYIAQIKPLGATGGWEIWVQPDTETREPVSDPYHYSEDLAKELGFPTGQLLHGYRSSERGARRLASRYLRLARDAEANLARKRIVVVG